MYRKNKLRLAAFFCGAALIAGLLLQPKLRWELARALIYLETGRVSWPTSPAPTQPPPATVAPTAPPATVPEVTLPQFTAEDLAQVDIQWGGSYRPSLENLMTKPLRLDLYSQAPTVLIYHSHGTEAYSGGAYEAWGDYRTLDDSANMIAIGDELAYVLESQGISVIHDRTAYDYPDYNRAYSNARTALVGWLEEYPTIQLVLDLHRDAGTAASGPLITAATVGGQSSAQLMLVVGTDEGGNYHPNWQENLALGLKLTALLERQNPGICRPIDLRTQRFNMDLCPGALLVEVGAEGNTYEQAKIAVHALAQAIVALAKGAN